MSNADFEIYLVDDDPSVLKAISRLLRTAGYKTRAFSSPESFLANHDPSAPGCAVFDLVMPDVDGLKLQKQLMAQSADRAIIFLTGNGSVSDSVHAMKAGAVDFLLKPVKGSDLLHAVERAVCKDMTMRKAQDDEKRILAHVELLTRREREVLTHVIAGRLNKQIAFDLGTVEKTIKVHRGRMMAKMGVRTVAELVRMTEHIGLQPAACLAPGLHLGPKANSTRCTSKAQI